MAKNSSRETLKRQIVNRAKVVDKDIDLFTGRLQLIFSRALGETISGIQDESYEALTAAKQINELEDTMYALGLDTEFELIEQMHFDELEFIRDQFVIQGGLATAFYTALDEDILSELIIANVDDIATTISAYVGDAKSVLMQQVILGTAPNLSEIQEEFGSRVEAQVTTEIRTMNMRFNRTVSAKKAQDVYGKDPKAYYIGPDDKITRPFCHDVLTRRAQPIYTLKEIEGMDNGQTASVLTDGGGYNCRHHWSYLSDEYAKELRNAEE